MALRRVALVTGGNKGIGLAIVRNLAKKFDGDVLLGSRSLERGHQAVQSLKDDGFSNVHLCVINIDEQTSINEAHKFIKEKYGGLDVLVNNAAMAFKNDATESKAYQAEHTLKTNLIGTYNVCQSLFPLLRPHARVVNVSSFLGLLFRVKGESLKAELLSDSLTEARVLQLANEYVSACKDETDEAKGWPSATYCVSKVLVSALTRVQQRTFNANRPTDDIAINHTNPGHVDTDMSSHRGSSTPDEGSKSALFASLLPHNTEIKGQYIDEDAQIQPWDSETLKVPF